MTFSQKWEHIPIKFGHCLMPGCQTVFHPTSTDLAHEGYLFCDAHRIAGQTLVKRGWTIETLAHWPKCHWCGDLLQTKRYEQLLDNGFEPGDYVYCDRHRILEGRDPRRVIARGLEEGHALLHMPDEQLLRWPLRMLHEMTGPLVPGRIYYVGAFSGSGKTTMIRFIIWQWLMHGVRVQYLPLESPVRECLTGFACLAARVSPDDALSFRLRDRAQRGDDRARVQLEELTLAYTYLRELREFQNLLIEPIDELTPRRFDEAVTAARELKAEVMVVDHTDHIEADADDYHPDIAVSNLVQQKALRAAKSLNIPIVLMTQLNSRYAGVSADPMKRLSIPQADWLYNKGKKEMIAAAIIGLHRLRDPRATTDVVRRVRNHELEYWKASVPNIMAISDMKARYGRGTNRGTVVFDLHDGILSDRSQLIIDGVEEPVRQAAQRPDSTAWMDN